MLQSSSKAVFALSKENTVARFRAVKLAPPPARTAVTMMVRFLPLASCSSLVLSLRKLSTMRTSGMSGWTMRFLFSSLTVSCFGSSIRVMSPRRLDEIGATICVIDVPDSREPDGM